MKESLHDSCKPVYRYCPDCKNKAWLNDNHEFHTRRSNDDYLSIEGVFIVREVLTVNEEKNFINLIDKKQNWCNSQEGREKQDFGPRVNFLQQKVSIGNFQGFPEFAVKIFKSLQERYPDQLDDFVPIEFCLLDYAPERGSYIRPHYDDKWIWGERLVTVNLLSETFLRLTREFNSPPCEIAISMPARSLLIIQGEARYVWLHSINRYDIKSRRVAMTWREFGREILEEKEHAEFVAKTLEIARQVVE